jgi:hypothetical protein
MPCHADDEQQERECQDQPCQEAQSVNVGIDHPGTLPERAAQVRAAAFAGLRGIGPIECIMAVPRSLSIGPAMRCSDICR